MKVKALIFIKEESTRLANKNFLDFNGKPLFRTIIDKLESIGLIEEIIIDTDSELVKQECNKNYTKAFIIDRPEHLRSSTITANTLIDYELSCVKGEHFFQTHCTNPLLSEKTIITAIETYFKNLTTYDSLFSVEKIQKRVYNVDGTPINHKNVKLEQTQDLDPVYVENSNMFIFSRTSFYKASKSRVGLKPQFFVMNDIEGTDIDYYDDFILSSLIYKNRNLFENLQ